MNVKKEEKKIEIIAPADCLMGIKSIKKGQSVFVKKAELDAYIEKGWRRVKNVKKPAIKKIKEIEK